MKKENIKTYTMDDINRMIKSGDFHATEGQAAPMSLDSDFWENAQVVFPNGTKIPLSLRIDPDVVDWFKSTGKGYLTRMNAVLRAYVTAQKQRDRE